MFRSYSYIFLALILSGWVFYQLVIKKKKISQLKDEIWIILFFLGIWTAIYYWALH